MNYLDAESQTPRPGEHIEVTQSLCARDATLDCEEDAEFNLLLAAFRQEHQPAGPTEDFLVQQMVAAYWKTRRLTRMEAGVLSHQCDWTPGIGLSDYSPPIEPSPHAERDLATKTLGMAIHQDCSHGDVLVKLTRCTCSTDLLFHRALQQLQRLQRRRKSTPAA